MQRGRAFSLIELLVVMAVLSALMAILLPVLGAARNQARRVVCAGQQRQIGLAWQAYLLDHEGRFPQAIDAHLWFGGWLGLLGQQMRWSPRPLNPYAGLPSHADIHEDQAKLFGCPADRGGSPDDDTETVYRVNGNSYCTNIFLVGQDQVGTDRPGSEALHAAINGSLKHMSLSKVSNSPSRILFYGDYGWIHTWDRQDNIVDFDTLNWHAKAGSFNVAFLDGHVRFLHIQEKAYITPSYTLLPFEKCNSLVPPP